MSEQRAEAIIDRYLAGSRRKRATLADEAARLAQQLHREGVDLCMSKATEFSPRIKPLFLAAAKLARIGYGDDQAALAKFERAIGTDASAVRAYRSFAKRLDAS